MGPTMAPDLLMPVDQPSALARLLTGQYRPIFEYTSTTPANR